MMSASLLYGADNEIYIDQSGATFNLDAEQLGSGNIIGGARCCWVNDCIRLRWWCTDY